MVQPLILRIFRRFLKLPMLKNPPPPARVLPDNGGSIATRAKIMYYLLIGIINACFKFQNVWLKITLTRCNCAHFSPMPLG